MRTGADHDGTMDGVRQVPGLGQGQGVAGGSVDSAVGPPDALAGDEVLADLPFAGVLQRLAHYPLRVRRPLLRLLWRATLSRRDGVGFGLEPLLSRHLKLGAAQAHAMAVEHDFHDSLQILEWLAGLARSRAQLIADARTISVSDEALVERMAASQGNVILASMHMGIFPISISYLLWRFFNGRRLLVLRAREDHQRNVAAMARLQEVASEVYILNTRNEGDFMEAMRFARKGAVVLSMIDLPHTYGNPAAITLFRQAASIGFGLDAMARMLNAVVLPMTTVSSLSGDRIVFGQPFEVWQNSPADRNRLAGAVARQIESFISLDPPQWHMWTRLDEFFLDRPVAPSRMEEDRNAGMA
ncbi:hypothetical protein [Rhizobium sp. SSA_523]|uniref:LpxL/LpxP family acyltransferase n=1 Tax=Rhizobium sp. SSA_523 TaxID=2952477 RepID=UPI002091C47F|nr:hypothetical protein [Rhizobium sp. SSA_523]MCO5732448.1 hypothetical protein [Rhizobium sp. SSA_523]WKC22409.1 hypothetical protein QTJ18_04525 [Rhizobium sp. SSA_523]